MALRSTQGWQIVTHVSIGPIRFGMTRAEVRKVIGVKPSTQRKASSSTNAFDALALGGERATFRWEDASGAVHDSPTKVGADHVHVYYSDDDRGEAVEISCAKGPGGPELDGRGLLNRPYDRALAWVRERDPDVVLTDVGLRSKKLGIALTASEGQVEGVLAFDAAYWNGYPDARKSQGPID